MRLSLSIGCKTLRLCSLIFSRNFTFVNKSTLKFTTFAMDPQEQAKKAAACNAINDHILGDCVVGIGSGSTIVYAVEQLAKIVKEKKFRIPCIPTSFQAKQLIREHNLHLSDLEEHQELDFVFDGADEVDAHLTLIKGGGGCLTQEKIVASCTQKLIIIADSRKDSKTLGTNWTKGIPIEVIPMAYMPIKKRLEALGGPAELRMAKAKAGPLVTDNGNFILDWKFSSKDIDWKSVNQKIICFPGVVDTGLFVEMATKVYFGQSDGTVSIRK